MHACDHTDRVIMDPTQLQVLNLWLPCILHGRTIAFSFWISIISKQIVACESCCVDLN